MQATQIITLIVIGLARDLKLSRRTVQRAITDLEQSGYLIKEQRWRENGGKSSLLFTVK